MEYYHSSRTKMGFDKMLHMLACIVCESHTVSSSRGSGVSCPKKILKLCPPEIESASSYD